MTRRKLNSIARIGVIVTVLSFLLYGWLAGHDIGTIVERTYFMCFGIGMMWWAIRDELEH